MIRTDGPTRAAAVFAAVIRACAEHGYFDASRCPTCGAPGREVLDDEQRTRLSKFLSGALRHFPNDAGIELDSRGWTGIDALVTAAERQYTWADRERVEAVVATDPKGRFERIGDLIRAAYGHSVGVDIDDVTGPEEIPDVLYHGTAPRNLDSIRSEGLEPMARQRVHLSATIEGAADVGYRHDDTPVVLEVDAAAMLGDGLAIAKRGPETFTTEHVSPQYLDVFDRR